MAATPAVPAEAPLDEVFDQIRRLALERDRGAFASLEGGRLVERSANHVEVAVRSAFQAQRLRERTRELEEVCEQVFGTPTRVEFSSLDAPAEEPTGPAPDANPDSGRQGARERTRQIRQAALQNEAVNTALEVLEAQIVDIAPHGGPQA